MTVVGSNNYTQCNFENITACRLDYSIKKFPAAILNRLSGVSLTCSFV